MRISLKWKILFYFLVIASIPAIFTFFLNASSRRAAADIEKNCISIADITSKFTEHFFLSALKAVIASGELPQEKETLKKIYSNYKFFSSVFLISPSGKVHSFWGNRPRISEIFLKNISKKEAGISDIIQGKVTAYYHLKDGNILCGEIEMNEIQNALNKVKPFEGSFFLLEDEHSNILFGEKEKKKGLFKISSEMPNFPGWKVHLLVPRKEAFAGPVWIKNFGIFFSILAFVLAGAAAFYFSKKILHPLEELSRGASFYSNGDFSYTINLKTGDELELLASQFNKMAKKIFEIQRGMDEQLKQYARDLANALKETNKNREELARADQYKSQFLASMSHELRTPMNAIIGFTDLIKDGVYGEVSEKQKEILGKIQRNSNHLLNLINDILDLSKIEAGRMELLPEEFAIKDLISDVASNFSATAEIGFEVSCPDEIRIFQDPVRLRQILFNLLANAFKFTEKGVVSLKVVPRKNVISVEVSDTGPGIKKEDMDKIFDSFQRLQQSHKISGTGLGLSVSKRLVELMGGWIEVESEFGKGSVFTVNIPYEYKTDSK